MVLRRVLRASAAWLLCGSGPSLTSARRADVTRASRTLDRGIREAVRRATSGPADRDRLAARERGLVALLAAGYSYKEIAVALGMGYGAVHHLLKGLYRRYRVHTKLGLVRAVAGTA